MQFIQIEDKYININNICSMNLKHKDIVDKRCYGVEICLTNSTSHTFYDGVDRIHAFKIMHTIANYLNHPGDESIIMNICQNMNREIMKIIDDNDTDSEEEQN